MYQRLIISGTLVYMYDYPLLQCTVLIMNGIMMIFYVIAVKPHKLEN